MRYSLLLAFCALAACASASLFYTYAGLLLSAISVAECAVTGCQRLQDGDYFTGVKDLFKGGLEAVLIMGLARRLDRNDAAQDWAQGPRPIPARGYPYPPNLLSSRSQSHRNYTMEELYIKQNEPMSIAIYEAFTGNSGPHHFKRDTVEWPDVKYVEDDGHFELEIAASPDAHKLDKRQSQFEEWNRISMYVLEHAEGNWEVADDGDYIDNHASDAAGAISTSGAEAICGRFQSEDEQGTAYFRMRMRHVSTSVEDLTLNGCDDNSRY